MIMNVLFLLGMFILVIEAGACLAIITDELEREKKDNEDKN